MVKYVIVQAVDFNGAVKYNQRIKGKKNQLAALRDAMSALEEGGYLRTQVEGAKGWGAWHYQKGFDHAEPLFSRESQYASAMTLFEGLDA